MFSVYQFFVVAFVYGAVLGVGVCALIDVWAEL